MMNKAEQQPETTRFNLKTILTDTVMGSFIYVYDHITDVFKELMVESLREAGSKRYINYSVSTTLSVPLKSISILLQYSAHLLQNDHDVPRAVHETSKDVVFDLIMSVLFSDPVSKTFTYSGIAAPITVPLANKLQELREKLDSMPPTFLQDIKLLEGILRAPEGFLTIKACLKDWMMSPLELMDEVHAVSSNDIAIEPSLFPTMSVIRNTLDAIREGILPPAQTPSTLIFSPAPSASVEPLFTPRLGQQIMSEFSHLTQEGFEQKEILPDRPSFNQESVPSVFSLGVGLHAPTGLPTRNVQVAFSSGHDSRGVDVTASTDVVSILMASIDAIHFISDWTQQSPKEKLVNKLCHALEKNNMTAFSQLMEKQGLTVDEQRMFYFIASNPALRSDYLSMIRAGWSHHSNDQAQGHIKELLLHDIKVLKQNERAHGLCYNDTYQERPFSAKVRALEHVVQRQNVRDMLLTHIDLQISEKPVSQTTLDAIDYFKKNPTQAATSARMKGDFQQLNTLYNDAYQRTRDHIVRDYHNGLIDDAQRQATQLGKDFPHIQASKTLGQALLRSTTINNHVQRSSELLNEGHLSEAWNEVDRCLALFPNNPTLIALQEKLHDKPSLLVKALDLLIIDKMKADAFMAIAFNDIERSYSYKLDYAQALNERGYLDSAQQHAQDVDAYLSSQSASQPLSDHDAQLHDRAIIMSLTIELDKNVLSRSYESLIADCHRVLMPEKITHFSEFLCHLYDLNETDILIKVDQLKSDSSCSEQEKAEIKQKLNDQLLKNQIKQFDLASSQYDQNTHNDLFFFKSMDLALSLEQYDFLGKMIANELNTAQKEKGAAFTPEQQERFNMARHAAFMYGMQGNEQNEWFARRAMKAFCFDGMSPKEKAKHQVYHSRFARKHGDIETEKSHLRKALKLDPTDTLIAMEIFSVLGQQLADIENKQFGVDIASHCLKVYTHWLKHSGHLTKHEKVYVRCVEALDKVGLSCASLYLRSKAMCVKNEINQFKLVQRFTDKDGKFDAEALKQYKILHKTELSAQLQKAKIYLARLKVGLYAQSMLPFSDSELFETADLLIDGATAGVDSFSAAVRSRSLLIDSPEIFQALTCDDLTQLAEINFEHLFDIFASGIGILAPIACFAFRDYYPNRRRMGDAPVGSVDIAAENTLLLLDLSTSCSKYITSCIEKTTLYQGAKRYLEAHSPNAGLPALHIAANVMPPVLVGLIFVKAAPVIKAAGVTATKAVVSTAITYWVSGTAGKIIVISTGVVGLGIVGFASYQYNNHCWYQNLLHNTKTKLALIGSENQQTDLCLEEAKKHAQELVAFYPNDVDASLALENITTIENMVNEAKRPMSQEQLGSLSVRLMLMDEVTRQQCERALHTTLEQDTAEIHQQINQLHQNSILDAGEKTSQVFLKMEELAANYHKRYHLFTHQASMATDKTILNDNKLKVGKEIVRLELNIALHKKEDLPSRVLTAKRIIIDSAFSQQSDVECIRLMSQASLIDEALKPLSERNITAIFMHLQVLNSDDCRTRLSYGELLYEGYKKELGAFEQKINALQQDESLQPQEKLARILSYYSNQSNLGEHYYQILAHEAQAMPTEKDLVSHQIDVGKIILDLELECACHRPQHSAPHLLKVEHYLQQWRHAIAADNALSEQCQVMTPYESKAIILNELTKVVAKQDHMIILAHLQKLDSAARSNYAQIAMNAFSEARRLIIEQLHPLQQDETKQAECKTLIDQLEVLDQQEFPLITQESNHALNNDSLFIYRLRLAAHLKTLTEVDRDSLQVLIDNKLTSEREKQNQDAIYNIPEQLLNQMKVTVFKLGLESNQSVRAEFKKQLQSIAQYDQLDSEKAQTHRFSAGLIDLDTYLDRSTVFEHYQKAYTLEPHHIDGALSYATECCLQMDYGLADDVLSQMITRLKASEAKLDSSANRKKLELDVSKLESHRKDFKERGFNATKYYKNITLQAVTQCLKWASQSKEFSSSQQRVAKELLESLKLSGLLANFWAQLSQHAKTSASGVSLMLSRAQLSYAWGNMGLHVAEPVVGYITDSNIKKDVTFLLRSIGFYIESLQMTTSMVGALYGSYPSFVKILSTPVTIQGYLRIGLESTHFLSIPGAFVQKQGFDLERAKGRAPTSFLNILAEDMTWMLSHPKTLLVLGLYSNMSILRDGIGFVLSKCSPNQLLWLESIAEKCYGFGQITPKILENADGMALLISGLIIRSMLRNYLYERRSQNTLHNVQTILSLLSQEKITSDVDWQSLLESLNCVFDNDPDNEEAKGLIAVSTAMAQTQNNHVSFEKIIQDLEDCCLRFPQHAVTMVLTQLHVISKKLSDVTLSPEEVQDLGQQGITVSKRLYSLHPSVQMIALNQQLSYELHLKQHLPALLTLEKLELLQEQFTPEFRQKIVLIKKELINALSKLSENTGSSDAGALQLHRFFQEKSLRHEEREANHTKQKAFVSQVHRVIYCVAGTALLTQPIAGISYFLVSLMSGLAYVNQSVATREETDAHLDAIVRYDRKI